MKTFEALFVLTVAFPASASVVFSNFTQPGNQFGPDGAGVGAIPVPGLLVTQATRFTPLQDYSLTSLLVPIASVSGPAEIEIQLLQDSGGRPGAVLESFHITGLPPAGPLLPFLATSVAHPLLQAGVPYWVALTGGTPGSFGMWGLTVFTGDPLAGGATRNIMNGVDQGWVLNLGTRMGVVMVNGEEIPEPSSLVLAATGIACLYWRRRLTAR